MKRWIFAVVLAVFIAPALSAKSWAETFHLVGFEDPNLSAEVNFTYAGGVITVSITNNTSILSSPDARLTAFAFNLPANVGVLSFSTLHPGWGSVAQLNAIDTPGLFGFYDVAAITGPNFHGGNPEAGIPPGATFQFSFELQGSGLASIIDEFVFLGEFSYSRPRPVEFTQYFIARFQRTGLDGEGSDVAIPGEPTEDPQSPEPELPV
jgi:hypothetical protein